MDSQIDTFLIELGVLVLGLAVVARVARRIGLPAIPFYLLAGLAFGEGGLVELGATEDFIEVGAQIGVILMLLMLGLEFSAHELVDSVSTTWRAGAMDLAFNFPPGFLAGLLLGFGFMSSVLLGGVTYISSSGVVAKLLADLGRIGNHETPVVLGILVIEDLAMVVYLPVVAGVLFGGSTIATLTSIAVALSAVTVILVVAYRFGDHLSTLALSSSSEVLLLTLLGITLFIAGLAEYIHVSAAIGAFLVGIALSGDIVKRARGLLLPLRNLFAAVFFVFFGLTLDPGLIPGVAVAAGSLAIVTAGTKVWTGWWAASRGGIGSLGRARAGTVLIARGEFSIVIAELGAAQNAEIGAVAATYVILLAVAGPLLYHYSDHLLRALRPASSSDAAHHA
jgi:K+:H+ antiporter subunit KhtU